MASFIPTGERTKACAQLNSLEVSYEGLGSDNVTLLATIKSVDLFYKDTVNNMVLFSASKWVAVPCPKSSLETGPTSTRLATTSQPTWPRSTSPSLPWTEPTSR